MTRRVGMYTGAMTREQLNAVLDRVRSWPPVRQDDAASLLLEAQDTEPYRLSAEERVQIDAALADVERGEVASEREVTELFLRYRR